MVLHRPIETTALIGTYPESASDLEYTSAMVESEKLIGGMVTVAVAPHVCLLRRSSFLVRYSITN